MRYRGNSHDLSRTASQLGGGPITVCDYSGFMCDQADTVHQMQYNGMGLYDTGFIVHSKFADVPNPQSLTPPIYLDPMPILGVKYDSQGLGNPLLDVIIINVENPTPFIISSWQPTSSFEFIGNSLEIFQVQFINTIFQMWFTNSSDVKVELSIQGFAYKKIELQPQESALLSYNMVEWTRIIT